MAASLDHTPSVLLVDDRPENLLALEAVLEPLDVHLRTALSGEEALRALLDDDFAVVLLDVQMPGMDGFETARFIRGRERSRATPIIFLTAVSTEVDQVAEGYDAGAVDYVLKPFEPTVLRSKVKVFCELESQRIARARSDELLLLAWTSLPTGAALVDADGRLLRVNPALEGLAGGRVGAGAAVFDLVHPEDRDELGRLLVAGLDGAPVLPGAELRLRAFEDIPVSVLAFGVREPGGEILSALMQFDDLRERRRLETERAARATAEAALERERAIASTLQRDLLPRRLPDTPGVALSAHFSSGGEGTSVGGDWFDAFPLPGGRVGLVIGDVSGRGVDAAARMSQLRSVTRAYAVEGHPPAEVIARLNLYHQALRADDLTTLVYAIVEPDRGRLRLVSAGHPPPALLVPGSHARLLDGACPALGIAEVCDPDEIVVDFPPGATLALYTDGLVERRREGIEKGTARLAAALDAAPRRPRRRAGVGRQRLHRRGRRRRRDRAVRPRRAGARAQRALHARARPGRAGRPAADAAPLAGRGRRRRRRVGRDRARRQRGVAERDRARPRLPARAGQRALHPRGRRGAWSPCATRGAAACPPATRTAAAASS